MKKKGMIAIGILLIIIIIFPPIIRLFHHSHDITYSISKDNQQINIHETFSKQNGYYLEIQINGITWEYAVSNQFHKNQQIIKDIYVYTSNQYNCILPVFKGEKILYDITCIDHNMATYYHNLRGKDNALDKFAQTLSQTIYPYNNWIDQAEQEKKVGSLTLYPENNIKNHYLGTANYKGITFLKTDIEEMQLFEKDIYSMNIKGIYNQYILIPNYNETYSFHSFYLIDIIKRKKKEIKSQYAISFDSYMQGNINHDFYLVDISNKKQYKIDIDALEIELVGTLEKGFQFYNGTLNTISANDAIKEKQYFKQPIEFLQEYGQVAKKGNYYYRIENHENTYNIYRMNAKNPKYQTYLFSTKQNPILYYIDDYIYFQNGDKVYVYHDTIGIKKIFQNTEFSFNQSLFFSVYSK